MPDGAMMGATVRPQQGAGVSMGNMDRVVPVAGAASRARP